MPLYAKWEHSFVVHSGDTIVALALIYERKADGTKLFMDDELHIGSLAVVPNVQGQGLGSKLLRFIIDRAIAEQRYRTIPGTIQHIGLSVANDKPGLRRLYQQFGFQEIGSEERNGALLHIMRAPLANLIKSSKYHATVPISW